MKLTFTINDEDQELEFSWWDCMRIYFLGGLGWGLLLFALSLLISFIVA